MSKFFNSIRRKLLSDNRLGKYLLYALGEIILVVIGILIAIKINAYNTDIQNQKVIVNQLENVALELDGNLALINETIDESNAIVSANRELANAIATGQSLSDVRISQLLGDSFAPVLNYQPNISILNEMIASGNLRAIENENLRRILLDFKAKLAELHNQESIHGADQESCTDLLMKYGDFKAVMDDMDMNAFMELPKSTQRVGNQELLKLKEFENELLLFMASAIGLRNANYIPFRDYLQRVKETIEEELAEYE